MVKQIALGVVGLTSAVGGIITVSDAAAGAFTQKHSPSKSIARAILGTGLYLVGVGLLAVTPVIGSASSAE